MRRKAKAWETTESILANFDDFTVMPSQAVSLPESYKART